MVNLVLKTISALEIIGGFFGIVSLIWWIVVTPFELYSFTLVLLLSAIYFLSIFAGIGLWKRKRYGRLFSIIIQFIQIPKVISPFVIFMFSFGFDAWIQCLIIDGGFMGFGVEFRFLFFSQLFFNNQNVPSGFGLSITSLMFLIFLIKNNLQISEDVFSNKPPPPPIFEQTLTSKHS